MAKPSPYARATEPHSEDHPVDRMIERRLRHAKLRRKILRLMDAIMGALGPERRALLLAFEEAIHQRAMERERVYFDVGFEAGGVAARTEARGVSGPRIREVRALRKRLRETVVFSEAPKALRLALVLELASALAAEQAGEGRSSSPLPARKRARHPGPRSKTSKKGGRSARARRPTRGRDRLLGSWMTPRL